MSAGIDALLCAVHERLGGMGLDITTFGDGSAEICWRRRYAQHGLSDERQTLGGSLSAALRAVLEHEDTADQLDAAEGAV